MSDRSFRRTTLCAAFLTFPVSAQLAQTIPSGFDTTPGLSATSPTWRASERMQVVYDSAVLQNLGSTSINQIAIRADEATANFAARDYMMTVRMSSFGVPSPENVDTQNLPANYGQDFRIVFLPQVVSFPLTNPPSSGGPSPDQVVLNLDTPFSYTTGNHLLIEIDWVLASSGSPHVWFYDAATYPNTGWQVSNSTFGQSCSAPGGQWNFNVFPGTPESAFFRYDCQEPADTPVIVLLGDDRRELGALALPLALDSIGAPGCSLLTNVKTTIPTRVRQGGTQNSVTFTTEIPRGLRPVGAELFFQAAFLLPTANALGATFSDALQLDFATPPSPRRVVTLRGYLPPGAAVPTSMRPPRWNEAPILELR